VFSHRLAWDRPENALAALERRKRAAGAPLIDLTQSNPTRVGLAYPENALREALSAPGTHQYDPEPRGLGTAREAVARDYQRQGTPIDAARIVLTASSSESYGFLFKLLCDPGDFVLVPEPSYPLFEYLAQLDGVRPVGYRLRYDGQWHIDFATLAEAADRVGAAGAGTLRAVVVVNPNNPTGSFVDAADLTRLAAFCADKRAALIADEVFAGYRFAASDSASHRPGSGPEAACLASAPEVTSGSLVFSLGGLSKACGLPQLKLGWIAAGGPAAPLASALARLELIADTYLSVGTPVQLALPRLLKLGVEIREAIQRRVRENRARLLEALPAVSPCTLLAAQGGWASIVRVPAIATDETWATTLLDQDDVLVHPGYLYDMPPGAYLVLSLLPEPALFAAGIARLVARCGQTVP
jgi:alanine-synthesizing transaminase